MDNQTALEITGGLSSTEKMPGFSYGIDARYCQTGNQLREDPNNVCSVCYALKGRYRFGFIKRKLKQRLESITHPEWTDSMICLIKNSVVIGVPFFRWHDSGDLQSKEHFEKIMAIARALPEIKFWLPTHELQYLTPFYFHPKNLVVRVSSKQFNDKPKTLAPSSSVLPKEYKSRWRSLFKTSAHWKFYCPAPLQEKKCGSCRACWKKRINHIVYLET